MAAAEYPTKGRKDDICNEESCLTPCGPCQMIGVAPTSAKGKAAERPARVKGSIFMVAGS